MTQFIEPEIEDDGYSIPKILVAVLLLILIGAGAYIYFQQKKLKTSVSYLLDSKKTLEQDLNQMIEKYNLAIDDNSYLEDELKGERDFVIRYRDSIRNISDKDFKNITDLKKTVSKLKETSAIQFANVGATKLAPTTVIPSNSDEAEINIDNKSKSNTAIDRNNKTSKNEAVKPKASTSKKENGISEKLPANQVETPVKEVVETTSKQSVVTTKTNENTSTTFSRVEIPPTYPGCEGSPIEKKACFSKKLKKHLSRRFDTSIVDNLGIESGTKRMWVTFNIDENGNVADIQARGPHEKLEEEAIRTVESLPQMTAARQNGRSVQISYSVPITIKVP